MAPEENDDAMQDLQFIGPLNYYETSYISNNNSFTSSLAFSNLYNQQNNQEILQLFAQLQQENDELKKNYENLQEISKQLVEKVNLNENDELKKDYENLQEISKRLVEEIILIKTKLENVNEENDKLKKGYEHSQITLNKTLNEKNNEIQEKDQEIQDLEQRNAELKDEASKYQFALGAATNFRLSDNDENNSVTLKNDILNLQDSLEDYVTNCKGNDVKIHLPEVQNLLKTYRSRTVITKDQKALIKAVLQRHVIEKIFDYADEYFDNSEAHQKRLYGIETALYTKAFELIHLTEDFANRRVGVDDTTKALPIKLRQQIFGALGNRGFNNIINSKKKISTHDFISRYQSILNKEIGKYRILKGERKQEIEIMASDIIQKVVTLFWFRLEVQEPIVEIIWFENNDKIDPSYMEGKWDDEKIDDLAVDICYFPLIVEEFNNKSRRHIYTSARIIPRSGQLLPYKSALINGRL